MPPIVHRDLTTSNVLLGQNMVPKVADFGLARFKGEEMSVATGKLASMAPEVYRGDPYDEKADVYSYGILACKATL